MGLDAMAGNKTTSYAMYVSYLAEEQRQANGQFVVVCSWRCL